MNAKYWPAYSGPATVMPVKIDHVALDNIACYPLQRFTFDDLTIVRGNNRTGKSTLVYALFFTLFGSHLNKALAVKDLCRKGSQTGIAELVFQQGRHRFKLRRATTGMPALYRQIAPKDWDPIVLDSPQALHGYLQISPEVAALSSFFREGEMIYFLQDIPRYNKTLLQNLLQMDDLLILQSRLRKVRSLAREQKNAIRSPNDLFSATPENLEKQRQQAKELEKSLAQADADLRRVGAAPAPAVDPAAIGKLEAGIQEKQRQFDALVQQCRDLPDIQQLESQIKACETQLAGMATSTPTDRNLQLELGALVQRQRHASSEIERLRQLENAALCDRCGQPIDASQISSRLTELETQSNALTEQRQALKRQIDTAQVAAELNANLARLGQQLSARRRAEQQMGPTQDDMTRIREEISRYRQLTETDASNQGKRRQVQDLENRRSRLQQELIDAKVALQQMEKQLQQLQSSRQRMQTAERGLLLCDVAVKSFDHAMQAMYARMLAKIRDSIRDWVAHFEFLDQFNIEMTANQLAPMVHARGYQYKLNQMSKSERIFLYLLLKLAIGDALSHLDMFVLDDPADGLDPPRKRLMAGLLAEVAQRRQVIVTTNDADFAAMFDNGHHIQLDSDLDA